MSKAFKRQPERRFRGFGYFDIRNTYYSPSISLQRHCMYNVFSPLTRSGMGRPIDLNHNLPVEQNKIGD